MTAYDPYLRGPFSVASMACEALTPILVRERGVVDDDLEVALRLDRGVGLRGGVGGCYF